MGGEGVHLCFGPQQRMDGMKKEKVTYINNRGKRQMGKHIPTISSLNNYFLRFPSISGLLSN